MYITRLTCITTLFCLLTFTGYSQADTVANKMASGIYQRIEKNMKEFQLDTTAAPDDKTTKKIIELRNLRGGFNINEAIDFKIQEDRQKNEIPTAELDKVSIFFKSGDGKKWLDNAMVWIYRRQFTYGELKQLVKFYKTSAGQKMATNFPVVMMQSLRAAEMIKEIYTQLQKK
ncbi:DUF2059 domain-containing protein [Ferruginibacter sp.]